MGGLTVEISSVSVSGDFLFSQRTTALGVITQIGIANFSATVDFNGEDIGVKNGEGAFIILAPGTGGSLPGGVAGVISAEVDVDAGPVSLSGQVTVRINTTRAGIHADGLLKNEEIYNCFDTQKLLRRPVGVAITDKTGAAGIKHWIESHFEVVIPKHDPRVIQVKDRIDAEYAASRVSAVSDQEMLVWVREAFGDSPPPLKA